MQLISLTSIGSVFSGMKTLLPAVATFLVFIFAVAHPVMAASVDADELARLQRGEILLQTVHEEKSGGAAQVIALFHTSVDAIWDVIGYCKNEFVYVRGLELCELVKPGLSIMQKHHRVNHSWYTPTLDFTFEATRVSPNHGEFRLVGGDLKVLEGQWIFETLADSDSVIATHEIRIRSRLPAPRWLVRRVLKNDLPDMMACVRGLARASGDDDRLAEDLKRCPGDTTQVGK